MNIPKELILLIGFYYLGRVIYAKMQEKKHGGNFEENIPGLFSDKVTISLSIAVIIIAIWLSLGLDYLFMLSAALIYTLQKRKIYTNGVSTKGNFYAWDDIKIIVLPKNSTVFELHPYKKNAFLTNTLSFSVPTKRYKHIVEKLEQKPVKIDKK